MNQVLAYWILGIPSSLLLGFACDLRAIGLWLGMLVGPLVQMILYARRVFACGKWRLGDGVVGSSE